MQWNYYLDRFLKGVGWFETQHQVHTEELVQVEFFENSIRWAVEIRFERTFLK